MRARRRRQKQRQISDWSLFATTVGTRYEAMWRERVWPTASRELMRVLSPVLLRLVESY